MLTHTHTGTHRHRHTPSHTNSYTHPHMNTRMYTNGYVCTQSCPHMCTCAHTMHTQMFVHVHMDTCAHISPHTHAHTYTSDTQTLTPSCQDRDCIAPGPGAGVAIVRLPRLPGYLRTPGPEQVTPLILCYHLVATSQMAACRSLRTFPGYSSGKAPRINPQSSWETLNNQPGALVWPSVVGDEWGPPLFTTC